MFKLNLQPSAEEVKNQFEKSLSARIVEFVSFEQRVISVPQ